MQAPERLYGAVRVAQLLATSIAVIGLLHGQNRTFVLLTASVADVQSAVRSGTLTYEQLIRLYLNRIDAYDKQGPRLNAVIEINRRAIEIARALDEERRTKGLRSSLHGIPIAVKDNIDVTDIPSAGGNLAFAGTYPAHDATVVQQLRQAGAIIFLKTNMDDLALGSRGLSSLGGQILNPYDLKRNPGGSSGGTAVAVNVGFATLGVGTETGFSIRSPASNNALVGIVPTRGLVSRAGVIPISFTQDRVGVHAKSVADAALLLTHLRGFDPEDLATADSLGQVDPKPYGEYLNDRLVGKRMGVLRDLFRKGKEFEAGNKLIEGQVALLRDGGAIVIDGLSTGLDLVGLMPSLRVNNYELRTAFDAYLRRRGTSSPVKTQVHQRNVGPMLAIQLNRFHTARCVSNQFHVGLPADDSSDTFANEVVIIDAQNLNNVLLAHPAFSYQVLSMSFCVTRRPACSTRRRRIANDFGLSRMRSSLPSASRRQRH
jgi:amidase